MTPVRVRQEVLQLRENAREPQNHYAEATSVTFRRSLENQDRRPGRPTVDDGTLSADRDALVLLLSVEWANVGWQLPKATTPEELRDVLAPLRGNSYERYIALFL